MTHPDLAISILVTGTVLFGAGCSDAPETVRDPIVRDSLGIRIVENFNDLVPQLTLSSAPLLQIGSATDTLTGFYQVEGAHRFADGRIVVANRGSHELRFFGPDGHYIDAVGRRGEGPGEFDYLTWMTHCASDTLYVYDIGTRRLTVFDAHGTLVRLHQLMLPNNTLPYGPSQCQPGGPFVSAGWSQTPGEPGLHRPDMPVGLAGLDGEPIAMIGVFPGVDRWGNQRDGRYTGSSPLPMGRSLLQTIVQDRVYVGTGDAYEIGGYGLDGTLELLVRLAVPDRPVTTADVDAYVEQQLRGVDDVERQARTRRYYLDIDLPSRLPPYAAITVDAAGTLWIQDYPGPQDTEVAWRQFSPDGRYVGLAMVPADLEVFEIGEDYILGLRRDDLDIEYVQLYGLGVSSGEPS